MSIDLKKYKQESETPEAKKEIGFIDKLSEVLNKDIQLGGKKFSVKKKEAFYSELEVLLKAGLDLRTGLELVEESQIKVKDKLLVHSILDAVEGGDSLSLAIERSGQFSQYEVYCIQIAEESGKLSHVLKDLATYFAKTLQYRRLLIGALSYPVLVISVAFLVMLFLLNFLVPLFGDMYSRLDQKLPEITQLVVKLSDFTQNYLLHFTGIVGLTIFVLFRQRRKVWFRKWSSKLLSYVPVFGALFKKLYLARFAQSMSFLLNAKVPLLRAIFLVEKMIAFYPIENSLTKVRTEVLTGIPFYVAMKKFDIYPRTMISLIKVGEEANQLDNMFYKISEQYNDEVEQQTKLLGSLIEPIMIVFLALIVGVILVSMYLPMFKLVSGFGM